AVADVVARHQVVGAVDGQPAVAAVPDGGADDVAAAHRVAAEVVVQGIAAEDAFLAQVAELRVADRAGGIAVVHGVPALAGVGGLDDHVPAQVRDLAAVIAAAEVVLLQRLVENQPGAVDSLDEAFLGQWRLGPAGVLVTAGRRDDDAVADLPPLHRFVQCHRGVTGLGRGAELDPGAAERGAVEVHAASAADDGRARILVHALDVVQADQGL